MYKYMSKYTDDKKQIKKMKNSKNIFTINI